MNTNGMRPVHSGETLEKEFLQPLGISVDDLAFQLCMTELDVSELVMQTGTVTPDFAKKLSVYLNTTPE